MIVDLVIPKSIGMNNLSNDNRPNNSFWKRTVVDERFEQNAGVKILKGRESYGGGSGFYALKPKPDCPNVNDGGRCMQPGNRK